MRKKIKIILPKLVLEVLNEDIVYFRVSKEKLCNIIIQEFGFESIGSFAAKITSKISLKSTLQFNLTEKNTELFYKVLQYHNNTNESIVLRNIFSQYINLHPSLRERIIRKDLFVRLDLAIEKRQKIKIYHAKEIFDVCPLELERDVESNYNNLRAEKDKEVYLYKVREIEILNIMS